MGTAWLESLRLLVATIDWFRHNFDIYIDGMSDVVSYHEVEELWQRVQRTFHGYYVHCS